jgi:hypothetical protein
MEGNLDLVFSIERTAGGLLLNILYTTGPHAPAYPKGESVLPLLAQMPCFSAKSRFFRQFLTEPDTPGRVLPSVDCFGQNLEQKLRKAQGKTQ